jgi:cysteine synthase
MISVGNTPLVKVNGIYAKLECTNPCGSIKDRIAQYIIDKSEERGILKPGMKIIEATSGNTGIALSYCAREKGYEIAIVMPENMTEERKRIIQDLGAELILCSEEGSFAEAAEIRNRLAQENGYFNPDQFSNPYNVECHYQTTGQEILRQIDSQRIDAFVAGVGTGGTLIGVGQALKEIYPQVQIVAVEPMESAVMSGGSAGHHCIPGIGDGFIPAIASDGNGGVNPLIDEVVCVSSQEAKDTAKKLEEEHGFCVGVSSGANFAAARKLEDRFGTIVTIFPDGYSKYQSQGLKHCEEKRCPHEVEPLISV